MRALRTGSLLFLVVLIVSLFPALPVRAHTGGPDPYGYAFIDNEEPQGPTYIWVEVSGSGQVLDGAFTDPDNGYAGPFPLGFYFPYYGRVYREFYVYANGYIQLAGPGDLPGSGGTLPPLPSPQGPNSILVPFSADLFLYPDVSHVYYRYDAANRRGIVEFLDMQWCCGLNTPHTFEIVLYPDGHILMQYQLVRFLTNPHTGYVAGIESPDGQAGLGYAAGFVDTDDTIQNDRAVLYGPGPDIYGFAFLEIDPDAQCDDAGRDLTYRGELTNLTGYNTAFTLTYAVVPDTWAVTVSNAVGPISNSDLLYFPIDVTIPVTATFDDSAWVVVTATAAMSPSIVATDTFWAGVSDRDLGITKTLAPNTPPAPNGLLRYAVTVQNGVTPGGDCGGEARDVVVTDTLPAGLLLEDIYPAPVTTPTTVVTWTLGSLDEGNQATFYVEMRVPTGTAVPTYLTNTAGVTMTGAVERGPFDNNWVSCTTVVTEPWLDLWVTKDLAAGVPVPGTTIAYGIAYADGGNVPAPGARITETIPPGVVFITATVPFTLTGDGRLVWERGALDNRPWDPELLSLTVQLMPTLPDGYTLTNVVSISLAGPPTLTDVNPANNHYTLTLIVEDRRADVWVDKLLPEMGGVPVIPEPGGDYTYWIHYGNDGSADAISVTMTDTLPLSTTVLYAGSASGSPPDLGAPGIVAWHIPALTAGVGSWVRVTVGLDEGLASGTVLTNSVAITNLAGYNITPTNDFDLVTATVEAADVTITKTAIPAGEVAVGQVITYVLHYSNVGPLAATGVVVRDPLPEGLSALDVVTSGAGLYLRPGTTFVWDAAGLAQGEGGAITITAWLEPYYSWPDPAVLTNTATISTTRSEGLVHLPNEATVVNPVLLRWYIYLPLVPRGL
jgi:uncharacterized repeat protein (TIGR01451 family)